MTVPSVPSAQGFIKYERIKPKPVSTTRGIFSKDTSPVALPWLLGALRIKTGLPPPGGIRLPGLICALPAGCPRTQAAADPAILPGTFSLPLTLRPSPPSSGPQAHFPLPSSAPAAHPPDHSFLWEAFSAARYSPTCFTPPGPALLGE